MTTAQLIGHRWAMEALHALSKRDSARLKSVFELPNAQINTSVKAPCGRGAAFDFAGEGRTSVQH